MTKIPKLTWKLKWSTYFSKNNSYLLLENLLIFLKAGYSLNETLQFLENDYDTMLIKTKLETGLSFYKSIESLNLASDVRLLIEINEEQGDLIKGLERAVTLAKLNQNLQNDLQAKIRYPLFLIIVLIAVLFVIGNLIIPQVLNLYQAFNQPITKSTLVIFNLLQIIPFILLLGLIIIGMCLLFHQHLKLETKLKILSRVHLGKVYLEVYNYTFKTYFVSMLEMKLSIEQILSILKKQDKNRLLQMEARRILELLHQGTMLDEALNYRYYTKKCQVVFAQGLENENLLRYLQMDLIQENQKRKKRQKQILFWLQPFIYSLIAVIIIVIYSMIFNIVYGVMS